MFTSSLRRWVPAFSTAGAAAAAVLALAVPAGAVSAAGASGTAVRPPNLGAATSPGHPWAVGINTPNGGPSHALVLRWNGTAWTKVPSPNPGHDAYLAGVAATSATNAWAVGSYDTGGAWKTLVLHWNGTAWTKVPSPSPGGYAGLSSVAASSASSASDAWAVGSYDIGAVTKSMVLHWNGTAWTKVPSPNPAGRLTGVAATSATSAWAVGHYYTGGVMKTLILHWNGTAWTKVPSPNTGGLSGVAATSATNAWAVGHSWILHWNGTAWTRVPSPNPAGATGVSLLYGVAATSASTAWAVGGYGTDTDWNNLILYWNGTAWTKVPSPSPGDDAELEGVAATSASNAWAVGYQVIYRPHESETYQAVVLHWNGTAWTKVPSPNTLGVTDSELWGVAATG